MGDHLRRRRLDLGLQLVQAARALGCHPASVANWEAGRRAPATRHLPRLIAFLGYDPRPEEETLGEHLRRHREGKGLSQEGAAAVLGVTASVLWRWETGRRRPQGKYLEEVYAFLGDDPRPGPATVGQKLKRQREQLGFTLKAAAKRLRVVPSTLQRWESGEREPQGPYLLIVEGFLGEPWRG